MPHRQQFKRSVTVHGRDISVTVEPPFWDALHEIARECGQKLPKLLTSIDADRQQRNFSSAIRVFVLRHYTDRLAAPRKPDPAKRRALALIAALPAGKIKEEVMLGLGYTPALIAELANAGLVKTISERLTWLHITEAGRRTLGDEPDGRRKDAPGVL